MSNVPNSGKRNPVQKKVFSLDDYKKKFTTQDDVKQKELEWISCSKAMQYATGLPGYPKGYVSLSRGFSNTGKSTSLLEAAVSAQKNPKNLVVFIDTENNMGEERLAKMGFDWNGPYIKMDSEFLLKDFGRKKDKNRNDAAIEDMGDAIHFLLNEQDAGYLPFDLVFLIDSLGTLDCIRSINSQEKGGNDNNLWNAGAFEHSFKSILNNRIPSSRKENKEHTNSIIAVQKIWIDSMGAGVVKHKGGEAFFYGSRLIYHHGGIISHGTRAVAAVSKGRDVKYGVETNVNVAKNHIDGPLGGISLEGKIISTPHGFITKDEIDEYKKKNILYFRNILGDDSIEADEILTSYKQIETIGDDVEQRIDDFNDTMKLNFGSEEFDKK
jgi:hypothetical protein